MMDLKTQYLGAIELDFHHTLQIFQMDDSLLEMRGIEYDVSEDAAQHLFVCRFRALGHELLHTARCPEDPDRRLLELHRKRALRRLVKQTFYDLLRQATGIHPAWGSMTGVRPTRLMYECLEQHMTLQEGRDLLMETFDLTQEKADLLMETVRTQLTLPPPSMKAIDIYIGIPFCTTRCTYCSFSSGEVGDGKLVEPYLSALYAEMQEGVRLIRDLGYTVRALYVGGGTPTSLSEEQFPRFLDRVMECFPGAMEYTVEAGRPDTITKGKLASIREHGIQRISINPQTMNDRTLEVIGRNHTSQDVREAYDLARACGIWHINMDVIAGLPGEHPEDFARTMNAARALRPESLTVHTLAIKRGSSLHDHLSDHPLPDGADASRMVALGRETARDLHLVPYYLYRQKQISGNQENVGYALPGHACQYNVDIMEEQSHILAFGAGGISKRVFPEEGHIRREPNVSNIHTYIDRVEEMCEKKRTLFLSEA
ncbi:MAG: coproporphyrinogen dehydrogenase HemZ [Clostridia bacterium]|nr:coproporphyrinogen dehydrogenase HemZ [Clostridia bacterium]